MTKLAPPKLMQWARSKEQMLAMQKQGWRIADQRVTHHSHYSVLMEKQDGGGE